MSSDLPSPESATYKYSTTSPTGDPADDPSPDPGEWGVSRGIRLTDHAIERWDERTPPDSLSPERAYDHAVKLPAWFCQALADRNGQLPDRVHLYARRGPDASYPPYGALFLVVDGDIVTIYTIAGCTHPALRAFLWTYAQAELDTVAIALDAADVRVAVETDD